MATTTQKKTVEMYEQDAVSQGSCQVGVGLVTIVSAMIGIWGIACLISGLSQFGVIGMIRGWIAAVMGI